MYMKKTSINKSESKSSLAFSEGNTKNRIKNILNYRKPSFWVAIVLIIAIVAVSLGLLFSTDEKEKADKNNPKTIVTAQIIDINKENNYIIVEGTDENSIIGDRCSLSYKDAEIFLNGEKVSDDSLNIGNTIQAEIESVMETYPTQAYPDKITITDTSSVTPLFKFYTDVLSSGDNVDNVASICYGEYINYLKANGELDNTDMSNIEITYKNLLSGDLKRFVYCYQFTATTLSGETKEFDVRFNILNINGNGGQYYLMSIGKSSDSFEYPINYTVAFPLDESNNLFAELQLPLGYSVKNKSENDINYPLIGAEKSLGIYDNDNNYVGSLGFRNYKEYEGAEDVPQAIYSDIALGNDYHFDAQPEEKGGAYTPIKENEHEISAITQVYNSPVISKDLGYGDTETINKGVLSYNKDLHVYIAIEIDKNAISDDELKQLANSVKIYKE